jgi:DNA-binding GntR family transcriptional regulator
MITGDLDLADVGMVRLGIACQGSESIVPAMSQIERIMTDIRRKIDAQEWPPGHKLPSDRELRDTYKVSQQTIRTVMERMRDKIEAVQGLGRFVRD